jgi:hypothetical protein
MIRQGAGEAIPVPGSGYSHERNVPPNGSDADQLIGLAIQALQAAEQRIKQFDNAGPAPGCGSSEGTLGTAELTVNGA